MNQQMQTTPMHHQMQTTPMVQATPQCQMYSSSSFYSYNGSGAQPHVYKAHSSMRSGPDGRRETRKAVRDSRSGEEKVLVGHHLQDRSYIREKRRNQITKEEEEQEDLVGFDHG